MEQIARDTLGAFYTGATTARWMARWALRGLERARVLEPAFGAGVFLAAIGAEAAQRGVEIELAGAEIDDIARAKSVAGGFGLRRVGRDFLQMEVFPVDVVIGNPPYVRLRHLGAAAAAAARGVAEEQLGAKMEADGSLWMPFVLQGLKFLAPGGRICLVLPHEATYVRYGLPLWQKLGDSFSRLEVVRVKERMFPGLSQGVVVLLAAGYGGTTDRVEFSAYTTLGEMEEDKPETASSVRIQEILAGDRPFIQALIGKAAAEILEGINPRLRPAGELVKFHIGYVSGDKEFFHPSRIDQTQFGLQASNLRAALGPARNLAQCGLYTADYGKSAQVQLFYPQEVRAGEARYIAKGEAAGVDQGYKCQRRNPWYVVPDVKASEVVLAVFGGTPSLLINNGGLVASNSHLCGYLREPGTAGALATAWYTSLTRLESELCVHALGGGVLVFVPKEADRIRVVAGMGESRGQLATVDAALRAGNAAGAFEAGDLPILGEKLGLTRGEVQTLQAATERLRGWRNARSHD